MLEILVAHSQRFPSGVTPANILVASMAAEPILSTIESVVCAFCYSSMKFVITACQRSCGKVLFSHSRIIPCPQGVLHSTTPPEARPPQKAKPIGRPTSVLKEDPPSRSYGQSPGGTHPARMHSCWLYMF